ncbi:MAG: anthranilate synthase component I family protein [Kiritimatiellaeota bacterium]|nr:anthranilate synthase component I family protein [Kiritimatiellota bacterium]
MTTRITLRQNARRMEGDTDTPISLFLKNPRGILFESAEVDGRWGRYSVLASSFLLTLSCREGRLAAEVADPRLAPLKEFEGAPFFEGLRSVMAALDITPVDTSQPPITRGLYGYLGYGVAALSCERLARTLPVADAEACLVLPGRVLLFDHLYNRLTEITIDGAPKIEPAPVARVGDLPRVGEVYETPGRAEFCGRVGHVREELLKGEAIQVVISTRFEAGFEGDAFELYRRLRRVNPSPYMFYMDMPGVTLMGASPELMVQCKADTLRLSPIAGTRKRGATDEEDALLAAELLRDPKEHAEHLMLVDLGRNDLGRIARTGSVRVERQMDVERFSHVMHLTSRISARLKEGLDAVDVIQATFPAGTVSGAPKVRAMEIIQEVEGLPRGPYAGCLGWIGLDKDAVNLDLGITIRSLWIRDGKIHWQTGAGVVYDSVPENEHAECLNKAAVIHKILGV